MRILVTGGAGYIGSHTCVELLSAGHDVVSVDNYCNSTPVALRQVERITGRSLTVLEGDVRDRDFLVAALRDHRIDAVVHFAGLKAVGESVEQPLRYYENNVYGSLVLLQAMGEVGVKTLVFSSSATVYGEPTALPLVEDHPLSATNPYGRSKLMVEDMLRDLHRADKSWRIAILRYFNPVGAHESGLIGEDPRGVPNNLMPFIAQVAVGKREYLSVFGDDYPTPDGTGVRDYIHVVDLAVGHVRALDRLPQGDALLTVNLGTGQGYSVLDMVHSFERASGKSVAYRVVRRRPGDIAACYADPAHAARELKWCAERGLDDMCRDTWHWQQRHPNGFADVVAASSSH